MIKEWNIHCFKRSDRYITHDFYRDLPLSWHPLRKLLMEIRISLVLLSTFPTLLVTLIKISLLSWKKKKNRPIFYVSKWRLNFFFFFGFTSLCPNVLQDHTNSSTDSKPFGLTSLLPTSQDLHRYPSFGGRVKVKVKTIPTPSLCRGWFPQDRPLVFDCPPVPKSDHQEWEPTCHLSRPPRNLHDSGPRGGSLKPYPTTPGRWPSKFLERSTKTSRRSQLFVT